MSPSNLLSVILKYYLVRRIILFILTFPGNLVAECAYIWPRIIWHAIKTRDFWGTMEVFQKTETTRSYTNFDRVLRFILNILLWGIIIRAIQLWWL